MYVCLCNRLTDRQILSQSQGPNSSVEAVYESLGVKPKCGKCLPLARALLEASLERTAAPHSRPAEIRFSPRLSEAPSTAYDQG